MTQVKVLLLASASALALGACTPPAEIQDPQSRTRRGALIGSAIGAAAGYASNDENRLGRAAVGAAAGAAAGAAIGQRLDQQADALRRDIGNDRIGVENTGEELIVTMPQDILFATDSAALRPGLRSDLRAVAGNLQQYPQTTVDVVGHTDNTGSASYNQELSQRRANSVASVLLQAGVARNRVQVYGAGEDQPVASNLTASGRAQNRRVEVVISPVGRTARR